MEEENKQHELPAPPRFRNKFFKIATLTLLFLALFFSIGFVGLEASSSSNFCSSCHEMKPEYYTWKASSHGEVDCVNCHIEPGVENLAKAKGNGLVQLFKKQTQTYTVPIQMPKEIPDSACETCHNVFNRNFSPSGDLIIPHDKHKNKGVECIQCHSGVAHAKIAERKMTYQTDYERWDDEAGKAAMSEISWTKPDMDTCMTCHKAKRITTECSACHTTGMLPANHKKDNFINTLHPIEAKKQISKCNECHRYMTPEELKDFEEESTLNKYINNAGPTKKKDHYNYAKENTFCQDCHNKRPASHVDKFISKHGKLAEKDKEGCSACHDIKRTSKPGTNKVNCSSCHPSSHSRTDWRAGHKIKIPENQRGPTTQCYACHVQKQCTGCHKD